MIEGAKESYQEVTRKEVEGASKRAVQKVRKDTGMKLWVIKLLTVCLGTAGAWWAEQTVTTATTGDRWRGGFPGDIQEMGEMGESRVWTWGNLGEGLSVGLEMWWKLRLHAAIVFKEK